jgi:HTH-type transcriptional regulator, competence development regulator
LQSRTGRPSGVKFTNLSKIEKEKLDFGAHPGEGSNYEIARLFDAHEDELLILAEKIPPSIRSRVLERPLLGCRNGTDAREG